MNLTRDLLPESFAAREDQASRVEDGAEDVRSVDTVFFVFFFSFATVKKRRDWERRENEKGQRGFVRYCTDIQSEIWNFGLLNLVLNRDLGKQVC